MQTWLVHDAKTRFDECLNKCLNEGPQVITQNGAEIAVLMAVAEWRQLQTSARPSLKALLMSDQARTNTLTPTRRKAWQRRSASSSFKQAGLK